MEIGGTVGSWESGVARRKKIRTAIRTAMVIDFALAFNTPLDILADPHPEFMETLSIRAVLYEFITFSLLFVALHFPLPFVYPEQMHG